MTLDDVLSGIDLAPARAATPFHLRAGAFGVTVFAPDPLRAPLTAYFGAALAEEAVPGARRVHLAPGQTLPAEPAWTDWAREGGKSGRKDAVFDLPGQGARLVRKVRSGVTFVQAPDHAVALGPLEANFSTVVNFINTQILSAAMRRGWALAHAAAAAGARGALAISGLSGGGKSTSILRMMDFPGAGFVSNDRVLISADGERALGIPKHPRINPGTILGNPRLTGLLDPDRRAALLAMPQAELWDLEEKHDLMIEEVYGPGRVRLAAPLAEFWVLNWRRGGAAPTRVAPVEIADRPDLLSAIMKSPGPFHQHAHGGFEPNGARPDPASYLSALRGVRVCEVSGRVDFDALAAAARPLFAA